MLTMFVIAWFQVASAGKQSGTATHAGADLVVDGSRATRSYTCADGQRVVVNGSMLRLTLSGDCGVVDVNGASNTITVDGTEGLHLKGGANTVTWSRNLSGEGTLPVTKTGRGNTVRQG